MICAKFRYDQLSTFKTRALQTLIGFPILSKYRLRDGACMQQSRHPDERKLSVFRGLMHRQASYPVACVNWVHSQNEYMLKDVNTGKENIFRDPYLFHSLTDIGQNDCHFVDAISKCISEIKISEFGFNLH